MNRCGSPSDDVISSSSCDDPYDGLTGETWSAFYEAQFDYRSDASGIVELLSCRGLGRRVFEIGCGTGSLLIELCRIGCECVACDRSESMVAISTERCRGAGVGARIHHVDRLPTDVGQFDCFVGQRMSLNGEALGSIYALAARLLRPGGLLMISHWNAKRPQWLETELVSRLEVHSSGGVRACRLSGWVTTGNPHWWRFGLIGEKGGRLRLETRQFALWPIEDSEATAELDRYGFSHAQLTQSLGVSVIAVYQP